MTYWNNFGKHQAIYDRLWESVPSNGEVTDIKKLYLEDLRKASKLYYRNFNDGDKPGNGESAEGGVFRDYFEDCLVHLHLHAPFLSQPYKSKAEAWVISFYDKGRKKFPWRWTEKALGKSLIFRR